MNRVKLRHAVREIFIRIPESCSRLQAESAQFQFARRIRKLIIQIDPCISDRSLILINQRQKLYFYIPDPVLCRTLQMKRILHKIQFILMKDHSGFNRDPIFVPDKSAAAQNTVAVTGVHDLQIIPRIIP